ncbi:FAD-dependent oxidoreductase [Yinghuangia seranimata]|uniref:FAD-dependent oxidoreductase n=1 Tax=Yinghuangia seranimata TaxID=408067 RepID=UPI00248C4241|nr:FAD-dependent oxidoreductase [Yinghuangia seranimata]MDI2126567.1 FAD-dependent oxidoreductase [Yinghuangia seranimata]
MSDSERDRGTVDVVVIGAGQAGLSAAYFLHRAGLRFVVLDADEAPGGAWRHRWPTLLMESVHGVHELPGMALPSVDPLRPARDVVPAYFAAYERAMELAVERPVKVASVRSEGELLVVATDSGTWRASALVNATGTWRRPFIPYYPGAADFRGRQLHTADYQGPDEFRGRHVVVVGGGTSATHFLGEIAAAGGTTTWVTRRPPVFRDDEFTPEYGRAVVAQVEDRVRQGLPPQSVVSVTGLSGLAPAVRRARELGVLERLPMFDRITPDGVAWDTAGAEREVHADAILWATGFRAALDHLAPLGLREPGGGIRMEGTRAAADPRIHLVGYGPSASTIGANRAGRVAVHEIVELLGERGRATAAA